MNSLRLYHVSLCLSIKEGQSIEGVIGRGHGRQHIFTANRTTSHSTSRTGPLSGKMFGNPGEKLVKKKWNCYELPKFEKNFYQEHPDFAGRPSLLIFLVSSSYLLLVSTKTMVLFSFSLMISSIR
uniref:Uncharacterized protein n=1 Tax=Peromyscus maniculatus bairdii TaxID=230844 RepID=A0A8C8W2J1_PERMB